MFLWRNALVGCFAVLGCCMTALPAEAAFTTYSFVKVTNNNAADVATGQSQMTVTVSDVAGQPNQVQFTFNNVGPNASSITDVYFDDGTLLAFVPASGIFSSPGVKFTQGASPGELPGGETINWNKTEGIHFSADSDTPAVPENGVNPGEYLTITFQLKDGQTYWDTIAAMDLSLRPENVGKDVVGGLRIGIHVQAFAGGGSESFVNGPGNLRDPLNPVPAPPALVLAVIGLAGLGGVGLRRRLRGTAAAA